MNILYHMYGPFPPYHDLLMSWTGPKCPKCPPLRTSSGGRHQVPRVDAEATPGSPDGAADGAPDLTPWGVCRLQHRT